MSHQPLTKRAQAQKLNGPLEVWLIAYRGAEYTATLRADGWRIHSLTTCLPVATVPVGDYGKEDAIAWVESHT